jgi:hypothetical protein
MGLVFSLFSISQSLCLVSELVSESSLVIFQSGLYNKTFYRRILCENTTKLIQALLIMTLLKTLIAVITYIFFTSMSKVICK